MRRIVESLVERDVGGFVTGSVLGRRLASGRRRRQRRRVEFVVDADEERRLALRGHVDVEGLGARQRLRRRLLRLLLLVLDDVVVAFFDVVGAVEALARAGALVRQRRRKVEGVDDAVLLEVFVHLVHLLADRVDDVLLVLAAGLLVGADLLLLAAALHEDDGQTRDDGHQRHGRRDGGDEDDLSGRQVVVAGSSGDHGRGAAARLSADGRRRGVGQSLAALAGEGPRTLAAELVDAVETRAAVEAGIGGALVRLDGAVLAGEAGPAQALVVVDQVLALAAVGARLGQTVVDVALAQRADEARHADALERVDQVDAGAAVEARVVGTVVDVRLAHVAAEAGRTDALEAVDLVDARAAVEAAVDGAVVDLVAAVGAVEAGRAQAQVALVGRVQARRSVQARRVLARLLRRRLAASAVEARLALARGVEPDAVGVDRRRRGAPAAVQARDHRAVVLDEFAVGAGELGRTVARVRALARVEARAAVLARLVVGAVVEVLVAEQAAPALVAVALPRLLARAVQAARIADALVAQLALPAQFAPATSTTKKKTTSVSSVERRVVSRRWPPFINARLVQVPTVSLALDVAKLLDRFSFSSLSTLGPISVPKSSRTALLRVVF